MLTPLQEMLYLAAYDDARVLGSSQYTNTIKLSNYKFEFRSNSLSSIYFDGNVITLLKTNTI